MKMNFGVAMGMKESIDEIAGQALVAEESGFSHMSFLDSHNRSRDVYVMMAIAALNTRRIHIGQMVTLPFTRHPSVTANATATVNELSGGRVFLGMGAGGSAMFSMGMKPRPLKDVRETVEFIRKYIKGEEAEFKGARMHSEWVRQSMPIYMAASSPRNLQMAGELADGVIFGGGTPSVMKWRVDHIERGAEKAGRDISKIDIVVRSYIYVADSKEKAHGELAAALSSGADLPSYNPDSPEILALYQQAEREQPGILEEINRVREAMGTSDSWASLVTQRMIDNVHLTGKPEDICEGIYRYAQVGVKTIATSVYTIIDRKGMMREIGDKIIPHFRN